MTGKVGIVTFHNHPNYGAVLQAYALKNALETHGSKVSFICDQRKSIEDVPATPPIPANESDQEKRARRARELLLKMSRKPIEDQKRIFTDFSHRHFEDVILADMTDLNAQFDFFVAGSDQVWNYEISEMDPFWFLGFATPDKRFSYAASFGMDELPENRKGWYQEHLQGFSKISVREPSGQNIVEELIHNKPAVCPDPVFLPPVELWESLKTPCPETIVVYMIEFDENLYHAAQKHADEANLPLIYITNVNITPNSLKRTFCTPEEWLGYFYNAKAVYTNSFHGISFSCLFHKPIYYRGLQRLAKRNNRISNLLRNLNAVEQICSNVPDGYELTFPAGWKSVDAKIAQLRAVGHSYLDDLYMISQANSDSGC